MKNKRHLAVFLAVHSFCLEGFCDSATVRISGTVRAVASITPGTPAPIESQHLTEGVTDFAVVTISELSNKKAGYTVMLQSGNAGSSGSPKLLGDTGGEAIPYTIKYGGNAVIFANGQAIVTDANDKTASAGAQKTVSISVPAGTPAADTYSDTLTVTLVNK